MKPGTARKPMDTSLREWLDRVDGWRQEGKGPFASRVIPVGESVAAQQWVLPTEQVLGLLREARSSALTNCGCRSQYQRCDNRLDVCFLLNDAADRCVAEGNGRHVSLAEAQEALRRASESGLVHLAIYNADQVVEALCSCCPCCCHDLQILRHYGRPDLIAHSDYVARTDMELCTHCGDCIDRYVFSARVWDDGRMVYDADACYGCGVCVTVCSAGAILMQQRVDPVGR